ncbi:MAG: hypothetical protein R8G66_18150 [Cytophagales bacterium]|nr:hypothetical protein [Cytophagales bacterium]
MKITPNSKQWKKWSLPSKVTYLSFILGVISLVVTIALGIIDISYLKEINRNIEKSEILNESDKLPYEQKKFLDDRINQFILYLNNLQSNYTDRLKREECNIGDQEFEELRILRNTLSWIRTVFYETSYNRKIEFRDLLRKRDLPTISYIYLKFRDKNVKQFLIRDDIDLVLMAKYLNLYADKIESTPNWRERINQISFALDNTFDDGLAGGISKSVFYKVGFPRPSVTCLESDDLTLPTDFYLYSFWLRRYREGNYDITRYVIERFIESHDMEKSSPIVASDHQKLLDSLNNLYPPQKESLSIEDRLSRKGLISSAEMIENDPDLIILILGSFSMGSDSARQEFMNLYSSMDRTQIAQLYDILEREKEKNQEIERKYEQDVK